jgi:hypothetical protein
MTYELARVEKVSDKEFKVFLGNHEIGTAKSDFDVTQANLIVSLSCTTAASTVLTFVQVSGVAQGL